MKKALAFLALLTPIVLYMITITYWLQADKEVDFLCHYFEPGSEVERVQAFLGTLKMSTFEETSAGYLVESVNFRNTTCFIQVNENEVSVITLSQTIDVGLILGAIGSLLLTALIVFQLLLATGKPWGEYAWGGRHPVLPNSLRISSVVSSIILVFALVVILNGAGVIHILSDKLTQNSLAAFFVLFGLSVIGNSVSKSEKERKLMTIPAIVLFLSVFTAMASMW